MWGLNGVVVNELDAIVQFYLERGEELRTGYLRTRADHRGWIIFCFRDPRTRKTSQRVLAEKSLYPRLMILNSHEQGAGLIHNRENCRVGKFVVALSGGYLVPERVALSVSSRFHNWRRYRWQCITAIAHRS